MKKILIALMMLLPIMVFAQEFAVKTNAAYWATTTLNAGLEIGISPKMTLDLIGSYNPFQFRKNRKIRHWLVQPELRLWTCQRFAGHFFGLHTHYGQYNAAWQKFRYQGWLVGGGMSYGYQWLIGKRWNLEAELGVGYAYLEYDKYLRRKCGKFLERGHTNYIGPTKLSISFMYFFR